MSQFDKIYGSRWFKPVDLDGATRQFQIESAEYEQVGPDRETKLVLGFIGQTKRAILNVSNARRLAESWGKDEASWPGKWLEADEVKTSFGPGLQLTPKVSGGVFSVASEPIASADAIPSDSIPFR